MAVVFAMLTSYFLSRTLVPTMMRFLMRQRAPRRRAATSLRRPLLRRVRARLRLAPHVLRRVARVGARAPAHRRSSGFLAFVTGSVSLFPLLGRDFFPTVDAGLIKLHVRGVPATRIEETERKFVQLEDTIRTVIPPAAIQTMLDNLGIPYSGLNLSLSEGAQISSADGEIFIALKEGHAPTARYVRKLRQVLGREYPEQTFFFLAPDISTQVLNFGLPAPIDVQVVGGFGNEDATIAVARQIADRVRRIPGAADVHLAQVPKQPELRIDVNRTMAGQLGLTERDVASDLLVSLASSAIVAPSFWLDKRGVQYLVAVQTPQAEVDSIDALEHDAHLHRRRPPAAALEHRLGVADRGAGEHHALQRRARPTTCRPTSTGPTSARSSTRRRRRSWTS